MLGSRFNVRFSLAALLSLGLIAAATPTAPASIFVDFDAASDLNDFVESGGAALTTYSYDGTTGVGSPDGAVTSPNSGSTSEPGLFYNAQTFDPADGPLRLSVFFQANAATASGASRNFLGFANNDGINLSTDNGKIGVRVFKNTNANFSFQLLNDVSGTSLGSSFNLVDGHWYRMQTTITAQATAGEYLLEGELRPYGADGLTLDPSFIRSGSLTVTNSLLKNDPTWTIGLLNQDNNGGATAFDNLSAAVVPEPAAALLTVIGGGVFLSLRPRSRRA